MATLAQRTSYEHEQARSKSLRYAGMLLIGMALILIGTIIHLQVAYGATSTSAMSSPSASIHDAIAYGTTNPGYHLVANRYHGTCLLEVYRDEQSQWILKISGGTWDYNTDEEGASLELQDVNWLSSDDDDRIAWRYCDSINLGMGTGSLGAGDVRHAIRSVEITGNITGTSLAHMFSSFYDCTSFKGLEKIQWGNVTNIHHMFAGCDQLTTTSVLRDIDTSHVQDMSCLFMSCMRGPTCGAISPISACCFACCVWGL